MISKDDWQNAYPELLADGRKRVGPPPTADEVEALFRGDLPEAEAERVRELLAYYPELARVMTEPFPETAEGVLTDDELAEDLARIRGRVRAVPAAPVVMHSRRISPRTLALVAGIVVAIGLGSLALWRPASGPRAMSAKVLYPDGRRSASTPTPMPLSTNTDYRLALVFSSTLRYPEYRLELLDLSTTPPRPVWSREGVQRQPDGTYPTTLSTTDLAPGRYRLALYGRDGDSVLLATYTVRLSAP